MSHWGRVYPESIPLLLKAMGCERSEPGRAYGAIVPHIREESRESEYSPEILEWMERTGAAGKGKRGTVSVARFTYSSVANAAFNGNITQARRGVLKLVESGYLVRIEEGRRGHAGVYVIGGTFGPGMKRPPETGSEGSAAEQTAEATLRELSEGAERIVGAFPIGYQPSAAQLDSDTDLCTNSQSDSDTDAPGFLHNETPILTHPDFLTWGAASLSDINTDINPEGVQLPGVGGGKGKATRKPIQVDDSKPRFKCPECGESCVVLSNNPMRIKCSGCGEWAMNGSIWNPR